MASDGVREKLFQQDIVRLARYCGWKVYHTYNSRRSEPGYPDLTMVHEQRKRILFVEVKTDIGKVKEEQKGWISAIVNAGGDARIWRPADWGEIDTELTGRN